MKNSAYSVNYSSPLGRLRVSGEGSAISSIVLDPRGGTVSGRMPAPVRRCLDLYFSGTQSKSRPRFLLKGTPLQKRVWKTLTTIPWGENISYAQLARRVKRPSAVRAVAGAVGKNPVAILIPCHRVIGSDGSLTGYAYGLKKKAWLLGHEKKRRG